MKKTCKESRTIKTSHVFPNDTNNHQTLFGGTLMHWIDDVASISAMRHCRSDCVTASTDSVDFLNPITPDDSVCLTSYVTWTGRSSMEVFVKVIAENLMTGDRKIAATSFLTFVALDKNANPIEVADVVPEEEEEIFLHKTAEDRAKKRKERRIKSKEIAERVKLEKFWL